MVLDLAEVTSNESDLALPPAGLLNFFYDATEQETWGFDPNDAGSWRVIPADPATARPMNAPPEAQTFTEIPLRGEALVTHPGFDEPPIREILDHHRDACFDLEEALDPGGWPERQLHQIGGWPHLEQGSLWLEAQLASNGLYVGNSDGYRDPRASELQDGADDWVLLAQIDTDEAAGWMWGDVGKLYFVIRRQDLAASDFDKVWMILQCG